MKNRITLLVLVTLLGLTTVFANSIPGSENTVENEIMTTGDNSIIISAGKRIYTLDMNTYNATLLATSPYVNEINSIASDATTGWIFYVSNHISRYNWTIYGYNVYTNTHKNFGSVRNYFTSTGHANSSRGLASGGATFYNGKLYFAMEYPTNCYYHRGNSSGNSNPKDELVNNVRAAGTVSNTMFTNGQAISSNMTATPQNQTDRGRRGNGERLADFEVIGGEAANALNEHVSDYVSEEELQISNTANGVIQQRGTSTAESGSYNYYSSSYNNKMYLLEISFNGLSDASGSTASVSNGRPVYDNWGYSSFLYRGELGDIVVDDNGQLYAATSYQVQAYNFNSNRYDWANNEDVYAQMAKDKHSALQLLKNKRQCNTYYYNGCPHTSCTTKSFVQSYTAPSSLRRYNQLQIGSLNEITGLNSADVGKITDASDYVRLTPPVSYKIKGFVFDDNNEDGNLDAGETKLDGVAVTLYADNNNDGTLDTSDTVLESQNTNATGDYTFNDVQVANTLVQVTVPTNDNGFIYNLTTDEVISVTGTTSDVTGIIFGINQVQINYNISGNVFDDNNASGVRDAGEGFIGGALITLYADTNNDGVLDAGDTVITTTTSSTMTGNYTFTGVNVENTIVVVSVPGDTATFTYTPTTSTEQAVSSTIVNVPNVNFGIDRVQVVNYNISGIVFDDDNENAIIDEAGRLENVTLTLYADNDTDGAVGNGDTVLATTTSATDGTYGFSAVTTQNTLVAVTVPTNTGSFTYVLTTAAEVSTSSTTTDITDVDFGINQESTSYVISGNVFNDTNGDGDNASDGGLSGVTVRLFTDSNQNGVVDRNEPILATTVSDRDGNYQFTAISEVFVVVQVIKPANSTQFMYVSTTPVSVALNSGMNATVNFGITRTLVILYNVSGVVWDDTDADQIIDTNELRLQGIAVTLYEDVNGNGLIDSEDTALSTITTSVTGAYQFTGVNIRNVIIAPILPASAIYTTSATRSVSSINTDVVNIDFGINITTSSFQISGVVFDDDNLNGIANAGEGSIDGLTVQLYIDTDASGTFNANLDTLITSTQTANGGNYQFNAVPLGNVFVVTVIPAPTQFISYTLTYDPDTGTSNPDGVFPAFVTGNIAGVNFGINFVDLNSTSRYTNGDDVVFTNGSIVAEAPEDVSERLRLYPNPTTRQMAINADEFDGDVTVEIYNDRGYKVMTRTLSSIGNEFKVDVQNLAPGIFYVKFTSRNKVASKKFIKR